jgi:hypothetical protein
VIATDINPDEPSAVARCDDLSNFASRRVSFLGSQEHTPEAPARHENADSKLKEETADRPYLRHGLRRGRNSKAVPSSDSIPASAAAPSGPANRNSGAAVRNRSGSAAAALSSLNQSNFWFDLLFTRALPPNTLTSSYYCRHSNKHARRKPNSLGHNFSGAAFGWSSFLTFVSRRSLPLQSAPPVNPACAALRGAYPKTAPCSLPRPSAPLRSGD